jgi:uncharacterized protein (TIGR01244 family)
MRPSPRGSASRASLIALPLLSGCLAASPAGAPEPAAAARAPGGEAASPSTLSAERTDIPLQRGECFRIGDFYLAGQPSRPHYAVAQEKGVKTFVNVRMEAELDGLGFDPAYLFEEELHAAYHHIPISPETIDDAAIEKLLAILRSAERPVFLHDSNGNRAWGLWAIYAALEHGVPFAATKAEAASLGIKNLVIEEFARSYLERQGRP